ncbi:MAG: MG2 domain-containing protein [Candidatus Heimdallarchaeota archaeon]
MSNKRISFSYNSQKTPKGIFIIGIFFLQLLSGAIANSEAHDLEDGFFISDLKLSEMSELSSTSSFQNDLNPRIESLIEREQSDLYERHLQIPEDKANALSNTSVYDNSLTPSHLAINIDLEKEFYVPGEMVRFVVQITGDFDAFDGEDVTAQIFYGWDNQEATLSGITDDDGLWHGTFNPDKEGKYQLKVSSSSGSTRWAEFTVSSLGLFWRHPWEFVPDQEIRSFALVLNTSTLAPVDNAQLNLSVRPYDGEWEQTYSGLSESDGTSDIRYVIGAGSSYSYEANLTAYFNGKSVSMVQWLYQHWDYSYYENDQSSARFEVITTTDKPLYTPGERINFRSLVWEQNHLTVSKKPVQVPVEITFVSPSGYTLLRRMTETNENGIVSDSITLDEDAELGNYSIIAKAGPSSATVIVKVDRYELPDFRIVTSISPTYKHDEIDVEGTVNAEYYFGQPVSDGQVELVILKEGNLRKSMSGTLSSQGEWSFSFSLPQTDDDYVIRVTISDAVGRSVESSTDLAGRSEIDVYSYISPDVALAEDEIFCYVWAYDRNSMDYYWGRPLAQGTAHFKIYGVNSYFLGSQSTKLREFEADLDDWGHSFTSWSLSSDEIAKFSFFRVDIKVETNNGREGSTEEYYSYSKKVVKIDIPESPYQPGDEVTLSITVKDRFSNKPAEVDGTLYVFDRDWDVIAYDDRKFSGTSSISFQLSPYAKSGQYLVGLHVREETGWNDYSWHYYHYTKNSFEVGSEASLSLTTNKESFIAGETIVFTGSHSAVTNSPLIVETVKRGIVGLYILEPTSTFSLQIAESALLSPVFSVNAYLIDQQGMIHTTSLVIEVNGTVNLDIGFDKDLYEPGDNAEITMAMKNAMDSNISAIASVSFVDSSIYGVSPDPEYEADYFEEEIYYPVVMTRTSWAGGDFYWWWVMYDIAYAGGSAFTRGGGPNFGVEEDTSFMESGPKRQSSEPPAPEQEVKIRDNLPEAAYWHPEIPMNEDGANISLILPDNIGEWMVRVVATTASGQGVIHKESLTTFLPFFVDLDKPLVLSQDDVIVIKGVAYNYLNETASVDLQLNVSTGLETLIASKQSLIIPSLHLGSIEWPVFIRSFGKMNASLVGIATISDEVWTDGMRVPLSVRPNGASRVERQGGFLNGTVNLPIEISESAISVKSSLVLSPGYSDVALSSWERLIGYPYGCVEQTLSRIVPDALVYAYLNQTGQLDEQTADSLENMITVGLSRLYTFQHPSGGWGWWLDDQTNAYMTATVLYGLGLLLNLGFEVDSSVLSSGADFILKAQGSDNLWQTWVWRLDSYSFTALVLRSLLFIDDSYSGNSQILAANNALKALWNESKNPYAAALLLDGAGETGIIEVDFEDELIDYLQLSANHVEGGTFWKIDDHRWRALGGTVETTAVVAAALARRDFADSFSLIQRAMDWITSKQRSWGWGSTADTSAAIRTYLIIDSLASNDQISADVELTLNNDSQTFSFDADSPETIVSRIIKLENDLLEGTNSLELIQNGTGAFFYLLTIEQVLREDPLIEITSNIETSPGSEFPVTIKLSPPAGEVQIVDLHIKSLETEFPIATSDSRSLQVLTENRTFVFVYEAPSEPTSFSLDGFEVSYYFQDLATLEQSEIPVAKHYGPILVSVDSKNNDNSNTELISLNHQKKANSLIAEALDNSSYSFRKKVSKTSNLKPGETIVVTLELNYSGGSDEYFLMIEDFQSAGLEPEQSSLKAAPGISDVSRGEDRITIFIPQLAPNSSLSYSYRVFVNDIRTSGIYPALLSSMYDVWTVASELEEFSVTSVLSLIDPNTHEIKKDHEKPLIDEKSRVDFRVDGTQIFLDIKGSVSDNLGLGNTKISGGTGETWTSEEFSLSGTSSSFAKSLTLDAEYAGRNDVTVIIEVRDQFGNVESRMFELEIKTFIEESIPVLGIILLIAISILSALAVSKAVAYWGQKRTQ